ncbi:3'-5' exonuclease isoform X2 [Coffea arabica]|uniref:3'-5' exonuclease n=1 Tax=Coffea arabica TaxID=13443 RepID=A0A6P6WTM9_COFAR|nr:Werner Syndrome-like exonuclease isoform X2 [Coffea arabica]
MASASSSLTQEFEDWDRPFTDEELQAIDEAVLQSTTTTDRPFTDEELQAIDDAVSQSTTTADLSFTDDELHAMDDAVSQSTTTTSPSERHVSCSSDYDADEKSRRRLPDSLFIFHPNNTNSNSFSLSPCHRRNRFPSYAFRRSSSTSTCQEIAFKGRIVYSRGFDEVEKSAEELLSFVELKRRNGGQAILGFDIEWRPTFRRGVTPRKTAVMQICGDNNVCYVMHVIHSGIPQNLKSLLENPTSVKVGVCIANDAFKIFKDHNVSVKALEDLSDLANHKLGGDCKKWSLSSLTETLICKQLPKPNRIRLGNWETDVLSKEQLHYAATDAFVSWYLYEALQTLPEAENKKIEESVVLSS